MASFFQTGVSAVEFPQWAVIAPDATPRDAARLERLRVINLELQQCVVAADWKRVSELSREGHATSAKLAASTPQSRARKLALRAYYLVREMLAEGQIAALALDDAALRAYVPRVRAVAEIVDKAAIALDLLMPHYADDNKPLDDVAYQQSKLRYRAALMRLTAATTSTFLGPDPLMPSAKRDLVHAFDRFREECGALHHSVARHEGDPDFDGLRADIERFRAELAAIEEAKKKHAEASERLHQLLNTPRPADWREKLPPERRALLERIEATREKLKGRNVDFLGALREFRDGD